MKKGKNVKNYFDKFEIALIKQYKECRFKVTKVFTIQKGWFGRPYREYAIYYGLHFLNSFKTKSEALDFRNSLWNNI